MCVCVCVCLCFRRIRIEKVMFVKMIGKYFLAVRYKLLDDV